MRRTLTVATVVALVAGSFGVASAVTGVAVSDLVTGDFESGDAPTPVEDQAGFRSGPDVVSWHDHGTHDHGTHAHGRHDDESDATADPWGQLPADDRARGLVFTGLRPGAHDGPCGGGLEIPLASDKVLCTHGPDAAPAGVTVGEPRSVDDLVRATLQLPEVAASQAQGRAATGAGTASAEAAASAVAASAGPITCVGDGVSGNRVQAIYAVAADRPDRFGEIAPLIEQWAGYTDSVFAISAAQTGGTRHVRYVTNPDCTLDVEKVVLSAAGDDNIMNTINEMVDLGYNRSDRKYLIWMDATMYCGIAQIFHDDRPGQDNLSNVRSGYARVDQNCWGAAYSVEAHELVHSLGGVQPSAPHGTDRFHCTDEEDRMCYKDATDVVLSFDCPLENAYYLDCNHDDYFHSHPPAGSYLATHWNVADSSFLFRGPIDDPANAPPVVDAGPDQTSAPDAATELAGVVTDDGLPGAGLVSSWRVVEGPGEALFADASSPNTRVTFTAPGSYQLELRATDGELSASDTMAVSVIAADGGEPTQVVTTFEDSLNRKHPTRSYDVTLGQGDVIAELAYDDRQRGKRNAPVLTVDVFDSSGHLVATGAGVAGLQLHQELPAGTFTFVVSGDRKAFVLTVTHTAAE